MKKLSVIFVLITLFTTGIVQAQKIASIDYETVLSAMPEAKKMTTDLEAFSKTKGEELNKQAAAFQAEVEAYQKSSASLSQAQRTAKEEELGKKQKGLQQLQYTVQNDLAQKREAALKPIISKVNAAVEKVAKSNGYDFIIDSSALIYKGGVDVTPLVKKELGIQ